MDWAFFIRHPSFASYVPNLNAALKYAILQWWPFAIREMENPTSLEVWTVLQQQPELIMSLPNLNFEQLEYFLERGESLKWIRYHSNKKELLSERLCFRAIRINPNNLQHCLEQNERLCLEAIKHDPYQYQFSNHLTFESGLESLKKSTQGLYDFVNSTMALTEDERVELELIVSGETVRRYPISKNRQLQNIQREQKALQEEVKSFFHYHHEHQIGVLKPPINPYCIQNQLTGEWLTIEAGLEEAPLILSLLPNYLKDYRLCRLAVARQKESRYFSPYHIGELFFEKR